MRQAFALLFASRACLLEQSNNLSGSTTVGRTTNRSLKICSFYAVALRLNKSVGADTHQQHYIETVAGRGYTSAIDLARFAEQSGGKTGVPGEALSRARQKRRFVDKLRVNAQGGKGGHGCVSFAAGRARGKFRNPDGGNGGKGGDVIIEASARVRGLAGLNHLHKAGRGGSGQKQKAVGARGRDCIVQVPVGTVVYITEEPRPEQFEAVPAWIQKPGQPWVGAVDYTSDEDTEEEAVTQDQQLSSEAVQKQRLGREVADLSEPGQRWTLAVGGAGGRGNANRTPGPRREVTGSIAWYVKRKGRQKSWRAVRKAAEEASGRAGERAAAVFEVRTMADIGLVGAPNAGKSSLLRALSAASPKVAAYPFTTVQPHLGSVHLGPGRSLAVADIPGLIPGAAANRGLGHAFLRHVSRARAIAYVLDAAGGSAADGAGGPRPWEQLAFLQEELRLYNSALLARPSLIVANKADLLRSAGPTLAALRRRTRLPVVVTSAIRGAAGLGALPAELERLVSDDGAGPAGVRP